MTTAARRLNPLRRDPTRLVGLRKRFRAEVLRRLRLLRNDLVALVDDQDALGLGTPPPTFLGNSSYFAGCPRDERGRCKPTGGKARALLRRKGGLPYPTGGRVDATVRAALAAYRRLADSPASAPFRRAAGYLKAKSQALYQTLEGRYGKRQAVAIVASAQVLAWGATAAGAAAGLPVWLPGSSFWGVLPAAALAETYLQASKGLGRLRRKRGAAALATNRVEYLLTANVAASLTPGEVEAQGRQLYEALLEELSGWLTERRGELTGNSFCPTGKGGGIDPTCGKGAGPKVRQVDTPQFKRWFRGSKVIDRYNDNAPLVVYHGTKSVADFHEFRPGEGAAGLGIYLAVNPDKAASFAGEKEGGRVYALYASIKNPLRVPFNDTYKAREYADRARKEGHDGLFIVGTNEWVAFHPTQVKSATGNRGTFDPDDPDVRNTTGGRDDLRGNEAARQAAGNLPAGRGYGSVGGAYPATGGVGSLCRGSLVSPSRDADDLTDNALWDFRSLPDKVAALGAWLRDRAGRMVEGGRGVWARLVGEVYRKGSARAYDDQARSRGRGTAAAGSLPGAFQAGARDQFLRGQESSPTARDRKRLVADQVAAELTDVTDTLRVRVQQLVADSLARGDDRRTLAKSLKAEAGVLAKRAALVADVAVTRMHAEAQLDAFAALGVPEVGLLVEWSTVGDGRVCPKCADLKGKVYRVEQARGLLPAHPRCRCSFVPARRGAKVTNAAAEAPDQERRRLIAWVLAATLGEDALDLLEQLDVDDAEATANAAGQVLNYDPLQPRDERGRWRKVGTASLGVVKLHLQRYSRHGKVTKADGKRLLDALGGMTVVQLRGLAKEHGLPLGGRRKADKVQGLADRILAKLKPTVRQRAAARAPDRPAPAKAAPPPPKELADGIVAAFRAVLPKGVDSAPIHEVRAKVREKYGEAAASHKVFDEAVLELWRRGRINLHDLSDYQGRTDKQLADSIPGLKTEQRQRHVYWMVEPGSWKGVY